jgi:hypothetical protein
VKKFLPTCALLLACCLVLSACDAALPAIENDKTYFVHQLVSNEFNSPTDTPKNLANNDISYCKFTDNYKWFTVSVSKEGTDSDHYLNDPNSPNHSWTDVRFLVTEISEDKGKLSATAARILPDGNAATYKITADANYIYLSMYYSYQVNIEEPDETLKYTRTVTTEWQVGVFYRNTPAHAPWR